MRPVLVVITDHDVRSIRPSLGTDPEQSLTATTNDLRGQTLLLFSFWIHFPAFSCRGRTCGTELDPPLVPPLLRSPAAVLNLQLVDWLMLMFMVVVLSVASFFAVNYSKLCVNAADQLSFLLFQSLVRSLGRNCDSIGYVRLLRTHDSLLLLFGVQMPTLRLAHSICIPALQVDEVGSIASEPRLPILLLSRRRHRFKFPSTYVVLSPALGFDELVVLPKALLTNSRSVAEGVALVWGHHAAVLQKHLILDQWSVGDRCQQQCFVICKVPSPGRRVPAKNPVARVHVDVVATTAHDGTILLLFFCTER